ncbi:MAG: aldehyde dehydrogenase family protein [Chloroflexota bacterium]|nr:aldehyde dehydrogenase family protein [Chloroflexota bacterium]
MSARDRVPSSAPLPAVTYATNDSPALEELHLAFEAALSGVGSRLGEDHPMLIGEDEVAGAEWIEDRSPADPTLLLGRVPTGRPADVDRAVEVAREAFPSWRATPWRERLDVLRRTADLVDRDAAELGAWLAIEVGKPRMEAFGEAAELPTLIRYYCDQVEAADGFSRPPARVGDERARMLLRPYGVWAIVSPFNFPLAAGAGMAVGAIAGGNVAIMKPASDAPMLSMLFARAARAAGMPAGVLSVLTGDAERTGRLLIAHAGIDGVAFTGSVPAGMSISGTLARSPIRRPFIGEMGGKNPVIVTPSADLDEAAEGIVKSAFGFAGQKCSATSRVYVVEDVADALEQRLRSRTEALAVGDPTERATSVGPVINGSAVDRYEMAVDDARRHGRVVVGGRRSPGRTGFFVEPTLVTELPLRHRLLRDELFLPILPVASVPDLDTAISEANASSFGLCAGLFSGDDHEVERFFDEVEAGVLYVNRRAGATSGAWPGVQPFTGWRASGSSGKGALGPWYVQQFLREQARTLVEGTSRLSA